MKSITDLVRPNIARLEPYSCARNEFSGKNASVWLDANENPFNAPLNRYPDPLQLELKQKLAQVKGVPAENIFLGNGSDEAIDLAYRVFCEPGRDNVVAMEPSYGMYRVCADINDVEYRPVLLNNDYDMDADRMLAACDEHTKLMWICTPNDPTGNSISRKAIEKVLQCFEGIVIIDEAYADFSVLPPLRLAFTQYPKVIVLNTMSKAWGCAAIRLGMAFADKQIVELYNKVKYPYNINLLTQQQAMEALNNAYETQSWINTILLERGRTMQAVSELAICEKVYPTDANFFLARFRDAQRVYDYLVGRGIIVRNRSRVALCGNCLRITIGTKTENGELLSALRQF